MGALVLKNHSDYLHTIYESDVKCQLFCLLEAAGFIPALILVSDC